MSDNDLIRRGDAHRKLDSFLAEVEEKMLRVLEQHGACTNRAVMNCEKAAMEAVTNIRKRVNAIPAAPQPMSEDYFSRLGKAFLARLSIPQGMSEEEAAEKIIEKWAQEHPERSEE